MLVFDEGTQSFEADSNTGILNVLHSCSFKLNFHRDWTASVMRAH
jgi:hypothetical protein